jgi:hypothetical protein
MSELTEALLDAAIATLESKGYRLGATESVVVLNERTRVAVTMTQPDNPNRGIDIVAREVET